MTSSYKHAKYKRLQLFLGESLNTIFCVELFNYKPKHIVEKYAVRVPQNLLSIAFTQYELNAIGAGNFYNVSLRQNLNHRLTSLHYKFIDKNSLPLKLELFYLKNLFVNNKYIPLIAQYYVFNSAYKMNTSTLLSLYEKFYKFVLIIFLIKCKLYFVQLLNIYKGQLLKKIEQISLS